LVKLITVLRVVYGSSGEELGFDSSRIRVVFLQSVQIPSWADADYTVGTGCSFLGGKAAGT
jgi:hypothetical protein